MARGFQKRGLVGAGLICCALGAAAQQPAAAPAEPQSVMVTGLKNASPWFKVESQHFVVYSNTSNDDVARLLDNLEKLDYVLRLYTVGYVAAESAPQKMTLYYHARVEGFQDAVQDEPEEAVGLYSSCGAGVQGVAVHLERIPELGKERLANAPLNSTLSYVFEAYARHFLYRYTDIRTPASYIDGFAQYFSALRFADNQMSVGRVPNGAARYLRFLDNGHRYRLNYQDILEPTPQLLADAAEAADPSTRLEFQAKSWLLAHYMLSTPERMAQRDSYLNLVHQDVPAGKAFEQAFGVKLSDLDNVMWRYRIKGLEVTQVAPTVLPRARLSFVSLPASATDYLLADAGLKSCPTPERGAALLRALSQRQGGTPNTALARLTLSRAQIDWGRAEDALSYLNEATRANAGGFDAFYLLGLANLRLAGQHNDAAGAAYLRAALGQLERARELNPKSAEAAYALYQARLRAHGKPDQPALDAAIAAWRNGHEVNTYARAAALALAYQGRGDEADEALTLLAHNAAEPALAGWAATWQTRLRSGVSPADVAAEMRSEPARPAVFREWTVAGENLMQTVEYNAGVEEARKYLDNMRLGDPTSKIPVPASPNKR